MAERSIPKDHRYDLILANLTADLLQHLAQDLATATNESLIASGFTTARRDEVQLALQAAGLPADQSSSEDDWSALLATKR